MKWRKRFRRRMRRRALGWLFPGLSPEGEEILLIAVPMPAALMRDCPPPMRASLCNLAYDRAGREAAKLVRERVGSSVRLGKATLGVS